MTELLLYGLNEGGDTILSETFPAQMRHTIRELAEARLEQCHAVEVWEGPLCIVRLKRARASGRD